MRDAWIISIGTELALGQTVDTNAAWIAARLAEFGVRAETHVTVADDLERIARALRTAAAGGCDLIVVSGGLGPTEDDLTRAALAVALGEELVTDPASLEQIRTFFARRDRAMPERNAVQAQRPRSAQAIENPCGTAPGIRATLCGVPVFCMPGVPFEMKAMFDRDVAPVVRSASHGRVLRQRILRCIGMGESDLGARIADLMMRGRNPEVGTTADFGEIGIRINATGNSPDATEQLLEDADREVCARLGPVVYGRDADSLAGVVGRLLREAAATLATAESCTGGWIGKLITDCAGSSAYYRGGVVAYTNDLKRGLLRVPDELLARHGAVSDAVARAMAVGVRDHCAATLGLSVTGIAGPGGAAAEKPVGLVFIGLADAENAKAREYHFGSDASRESIRLRAARTALNRVRLRLVESE